MNRKALDSINHKALLAAAVVSLGASLGVAPGDLLADTTTTKPADQLKAPTSNTVKAPLAPAATAQKVAPPASQIKCCAPAAAPKSTQTSPP